MGYLSVVLAAAGAFAFGAIWYMALANPWMEASGVPQNDKGQPANNNSPVPYVLSALMILVVAGMMRHSFALSGIDTIGKGLISGLGVGALFITPWLALTNGYTMRPIKLTLIDGGYATIGCGIIGLILTLF